MKQQENHMMKIISKKRLDKVVKTWYSKDSYRIREKKKEGKKMKLTMTNEDYYSVFLQWLLDNLEQKETFNFTLLGRDWNVCHYYCRNEDGEDVDYMHISVNNEFEGVLTCKELYTMVETLTRFNRYEY